MCVCVCVCVCQSLSHVQLFATPWTVARQASMSMGFSRQEYWSGLPFSSPADLPYPGIKSWSSASQADSLLFELHMCIYVCTHIHTYIHIPHNRPISLQGNYLREIKIYVHLHTHIQSPETQKQIHTPPDSLWQRLMERQSEKLQSFIQRCCQSLIQSSKTLYLKSVNCWLMCLVQKHAIIFHYFLI